MAINRTSISSQDIRNNTDIAVELLATRPTIGEYLDTPVTPGILCAFINTSTGYVELYLTDPTGRRYLPIF
jgi:hypothetical protein